MRHLPNITLIGVDCVDAERLALAMEICLKDFSFGAVKLLTSLPSSSSHKVEIDPITSISQYSTFILKELYKYIDSEFALIVQHDGFILNPDAWDDEFLAYDYIGAPWYTKETGELSVGNGGFSLRSRKLFEFTAKDDFISVDEADTTRHAHNEDWIICKLRREYVESKGIRFAPVELAHRFSIESNAYYGREWKGEFGFHGLHWTDIRAWLAAHPECGVQNPLDQE